CSVMRDEPSVDWEVISVTPAMRPSARSSGVATVAAMTSGLAPGRLAPTEMVGKSTCGSGETGSKVNATSPASARPMVSSVVATGRRTKGSERFIASDPLLRGSRVKRAGGLVFAKAKPPARKKRSLPPCQGGESCGPPRETVEPQVDDGSGKK